MGISRLRMGIDGKGVTTLVGFFGCPLHCKYCLNEHCHEGYNTPRAVYTPQELIEVLKKDNIYYRMTGGGITFGGGEPLLQSAFIHEVCLLADKAWKKRIETSLNVPWECVEPVINDIDEWIIDIKDMDSELYKTYTGTDNENLKSNLLRLKDCAEPSKICIRVPRIQGFNDKENVEKSVKWIKENLQVEPEVFNYIVPGQIKYVPGAESKITKLSEDIETIKPFKVKIKINSHGMIECHGDGLITLVGKMLPNGEFEPYSGYSKDSVRVRDGVIYWVANGIEEKIGRVLPDGEIEPSEGQIEKKPQFFTPEEMIELMKKEKQRREELRKNH